MHSVSLGSRLFIRLSDELNQPTVFSASFLPETTAQPRPRACQPHIGLVLPASRRLLPYARPGKRLLLPPSGDDYTLWPAGILAVYSQCGGLSLPLYARTTVGYPDGHCILPPLVPRRYSFLSVFSAHLPDVSRSSWRLPKLQRTLLDKASGTVSFRRDAKRSTHRSAASCCGAFTAWLDRL